MTEEQEPFEDVEEEAAEQPNAAEPKSRRVQQKRLKDQRIEEELVLSRWLSTAAGRRLYMKLVYEMCNLNGPSVRMNALGVFDPLAEHFEEGRRAVGLHLQKEALQKANVQYMLAVQENLTRYGV